MDGEVVVVEVQVDRSRRVTVGILPIGIVKISVLLWVHPHTQKVHLSLWSTVAKEGKVQHKRHYSQVERDMVFEACCVPQSSSTRHGVEKLKRMFPIAFQQLSEGTVRRWKEKKKWSGKESTCMMVGEGQLCWMQTLLRQFALPFFGL